MGKQRSSWFCSGKIGNDSFRGTTKSKMGVLCLNLKRQRLDGSMEINGSIVYYEFVLME